MPRYLNIAAIFVMAAIYILFIPAEPVSFNLFMKIIPMMLIIVFAISQKPLFSRTYKKIILVGLIICMIADVAIHWFLAGLVTFLIGHLFYIVAFYHVKKKPVPLWAAILLLSYGLFMAIWIAGTPLSGGQIGLAIAIASYVLMILLMGWFAICTRLRLAIWGALLFILSDSLLAVDRFVTAVPYRDLLVMGTYYAAQLFIAASIGSRVVKYSVKPQNLIK